VALREAGVGLNKYLEQVQRFARDQKQQYFDVGNLIDYVNRARREVAGRTQCIRRLTTISGSIESWSVTNGGSGYSSSPTLTITPPDFPSGTLPFPNGAQATATAIVQGGVITAIESAYGGAGYFQPVMTIKDTTGKGATAVASVAHINTLNQGQEVYNFSDVDLSIFPGVDSCYAVKSVSIIYANYRYSVPIYAFSIYQAYVRQYPFQYQYVPTFGSQYGQGTDGSFYLYPLPSQQYQIEFDMYCLPQDLIDDQSVDVIPKPWDDAVSYFAAALAFEEFQNLNAAKYYHDQFDQRVLGYSMYARPGRMINPYGRV
jgi:hypothetical protein